MANPFVDLGDFGRYRLRRAEASEMAKLKMKFPDMNALTDPWVAERDGRIIGLVELRTAMYIHNIHLNGENNVSRTKSMIAIASILQDMSVKSGAGLIGFVHKSKRAWQRILERFGSTKLRHSSGRIYKFNIMD